MIGKIEKIVPWLFTQDREKIYEVKEHKKKRSLSQNAYAWKLITEIGNIQKLSKEEVYLQMLKDYGQSDIISALKQVNIGDYYKYYEEIGTGIVNDKEFIHYKIFKGSSNFNSKEMSIFIDGIIQECKNLGIETMTKAEIELLKLV